MLYLVYRLEPTAVANEDPVAFWTWVTEREKWFYEGLDTVVATDWKVRTVGTHVHTIEHIVTFEDEAGWGEYRRQVAGRSQIPDWESRRAEQGKWWHLAEAALLSDPPIQLGFDRTHEPK